MSAGIRLALPLLALLVGFAAGTGFGVVVLSDAPVPADAPAARGRSEPPERSEAPPDTPPHEPVGAGTTRRRGVSVDDVAIGNALHGGDAVTAGGGVVTGTVHTESGAPLEGVCVTGRPDFGPDDDESGETLEARLRSVARAWRFEEGAKRVATTGADGTYRLDRLLDGVYDISLEREGYTFQRPDGGSWQGSPGEVVDFLAFPVIAVTADVRLPDGTQPATAQIDWRRLPSGETGSSAWEPAAATIDLGPGSYEFTATGGDDNMFSVAGVGAEIAAGKDATVALHMIERSGLHGAVTFAGPELPTRAGIVAVSIADGGEADPARLTGSPWSAWVEDPFHYSILDMPPGPYLVGVLLRSGRVLDHAIVDVGPGMVRHDVSIGAVDVRDYVLVRVRRPGGADVDDATIQAGYSGNGNEFFGEVTTTRRDDGAYVVPHISPGGPQDDFNGWSSTTSGGGGTSGLTHYIVVTTPAYGQRRLDYDPARDRELDVAFDAPAFAVFAVSDIQGRALAGRVQAQLVATSGAGRTPPWGGFQQDTVPVSFDGVARVGPVAPGEYTAKILVQSDQSGLREVASTPVVLRAGDNGVSLRIPALHELRVRVEGPDLDLDLHPVAERGSDTVFLDEGVREGGNVTRFSLVPPGRYRVRAFGDGSVGEMIVDVPTSGTVVFRPRPYDAVRVEGLPAAWRGALEHSDLIVAVNGEELAGDHRIQAALVLARGQEQVTFTVLRSGRQFDVTVPSAPMDDAGLVHITR